MFRNDFDLGYNCLIACFQSLLPNKDNQADIGSWVQTEVENTLKFLLEKGDELKYDMENIVNHTVDNGQTLFQISTNHSEKIANYLISKKIVKMNSITSTFDSVSFKVIVVVGPCKITFSSSTISEMNS